MVSHTGTSTTLGTYLSFLPPQLLSLVLASNANFFPGIPSIPTRQSKMMLSVGDQFERFVSESLA